MVEALGAGWKHKGFPKSCHAGTKSILILLDTMKWSSWPGSCSFVKCLGGYFEGSTRPHPCFANMPRFSKLCPATCPKKTRVLAMIPRRCSKVSCEVKPEKRLHQVDDSRTLAMMAEGLGFQASHF